MLFLLLFVFVEIECNFQEIRAQVFPSITFFNKNLLYEIKIVYCTEFLRELNTLTHCLTGKFKGSDILPFLLVSLPNGSGKECFIGPKFPYKRKKGRLLAIKV